MDKNKIVRNEIKKSGKGGCHGKGGFMDGVLGKFKMPEQNSTPVPPVNRFKMREDQKGATARGTKSTLGGYSDMGKFLGTGVKEASIGSINSAGATSRDISDFGENVCRDITYEPYNSLRFNFVLLGDFLCHEYPERHA